MTQVRLKSDLQDLWERPVWKWSMTASCNLLYLMIFLPEFWLPI